LTYNSVKRNGVAQWKTEDGKIREEKVGPGDTLSLLGDVADHQLLNTGTEKSIVFPGNPTQKLHLHTDSCEVPERLMKRS
jgi:hypothetical protein